ncbi:MAG: hypothetical protein Q9165_005496 [Trypethelium subeluteriae]
MPVHCSSTARLFGVFQRNQTRRMHGTPHRYGSPFFHLAALSASREGQFISKASGISRVDYTPNSQLLRAEACGSTIPEQRSVKRSTGQTDDQKPRVQKYQEQKPREPVVYVKRDDTVSSEWNQHITALRKSAGSIPQAISVDTHKQMPQEEKAHSQPSIAHDKSPKEPAAVGNGGTSLDAPVPTGSIWDPRETLEYQKSLIFDLKDQLDRERQARTPAEERVVSRKLSSERLQKRYLFLSGVFGGAFATLLTVMVTGWLSIAYAQSLTAAARATQQAALEDATWKASESVSCEDKAGNVPNSDLAGSPSDHLASWFWSSAK